MVSLTDIPEATLLHTEEPYAAIISKQCCETHCHFCFSELPADNVPCPSCSNGFIWLYIARDLENYVARFTKATVDGVHGKHECGVNWPAALPAEIVLAGRVIVKSIELNRHIGALSQLFTT